MRPFISIMLAALLCHVGTVAAQGAAITDPSQLSNTKVYTIGTSVRGALTLNIEETIAVSTMMRSGEKDGEGNDIFMENVNALQDEASQEFGLLLIDGRYYLYSVKLKKFAILHNQTLEFYPTAGTGLDFSTDGQAGAPLRLKIPVWGTSGDKAFYLNNNGSGGWVLNTYTSVDPGNSLIIEEVEGKTLDVDEAMSIFNKPNEWMDPHKVYTISTARTAEWGVHTDGFSIVGTNDLAGANPLCSDADKQWAFYRDGSKTYLFNVGMQMFLSKNTKTMNNGGANQDLGQLTTSKDEFANVDFILSNNDNYPFILYIVDNGKWFNGQGNGGMTVSTWKSGMDDGNRQKIEEVAGLDAYDDMQAFFEIPSWDITYRLYFEGEEIGRAVRNMTKGSAAALPSDLIYNSCTYEYETEFIESGDDVRVDVYWDGPFEFSSDYSSAHWYNLLFDRVNEGRDGLWYAYWEEGTEPYYPRKDADEAMRSAPQCQWAFVGNPYKLKIYNKAAGEGMTLANKGFDNGGNSAGATVLREGEHFWQAKDYFPDLEEFTIGVDVNGTFCRINQVGGAMATSYFGLWTGFDDGSKLKTEEVPDIDVTDVYFDVYFGGQQVLSEKVIGQEVGAPIPELPASFARDFVELDYDTSLDVSPDLHVQVTATWVGPFDIAPDFGSAHWYDMAVRSNWYVTSDNLSDDGGLKTVNANATGLAEDAYQWAFVGDPWHVRLYNKAKGSSQVFTWTSDADGSIPAFVDATSENYWWIRQSTASGDAYANAFMLTIPQKGFQVNQYGGPGGTLKIWARDYTNDTGSAFTIFEVPDDFAEFVVADIAPVMESETVYFNWNAAARAAIGYKPGYKETCSLDQYRHMMQTIEALKADIHNFVLPETGYYRVLNRHHGDFVGMHDDLVRGYGDGTDATTVVRLTKVGDAAYTIQLQSEYFQPLEQSTTMYTDPLTPVTFQAFVAEPGYAAFSATPAPEEGADDAAVHAYQYSFLHRRNDAVGNNDLVGWEISAPASHWTLESAATIGVLTDGAGIATLYVPFPVELPSDMTAYVGKIENDHLELLSIGQRVPTATPVVLVAPEGYYELKVLSEEVAPVAGNDLRGLYLEGKPAYALTLQDGAEGAAFYTFEGAAIVPNQAYLRLPDNTVAYFPFHLGDGDAIGAVPFDVSSGRSAYDLSGRRVDKVHRGVYILEGKKIVVR